MLLNVFWKLQFITKVFTLVDDFVSKKIGKFDNVVDVVTVFDVVGLVNHTDVVKYVVFSRDKLK